MRFGKCFLGFTACAALAGLFAWSTTLQARPLPRYSGGGLADLAFKAGKLNATTGPTCESTGFEAVEGACGWHVAFMCGVPFFGICTAPSSGVCTGDPSTDQNCCIDDPNPDTGWYVSISSRHCNEPHIDTANPATGTQHMRFERDAAGGDPPGCTGFGGACRISAFTPTAGGPLPITTTHMEFDLAMERPFGTPPFGSSHQMFTVADAEANNIGPIMQFTYYGLVKVYDNTAGGYVTVGYMSGNDVYDHFEIDLNPCFPDFIQTTTMNGQVVFTQDFTGSSFTIERNIFTNDNAGFHFDLDNYLVSRGNTCPPAVCGDDILFPSEECDTGAGNDDACPGRCSPPGDPNECVCQRPCLQCSNEPGCEAVNGMNGPFLTHGGWFSYQVDSDFTSIETCGSDFDTTLWVDWDPVTCEFVGFVNDECFNFTGDGGDGNHPDELSDTQASCYNDNPNFESCLCVPTTPGQTLYFWVAGFPDNDPPAGSNLIVTITKKTACGTAIPNGACCDGSTATCTDNIPVEQCSGASQTWHENKLCTQITCDRDMGACCDSSPGTGGSCSQTLPEDCAGDKQSWFKLTDCADVTCDEVTGACCDGLLGNCFESLLADCPVGGQVTWSQGAACGDISCVPATGACCDTGTADPTVASCTSTIMVACDCAKCTWTKGAACADIDCLANFQPIPTVSEWGLVVLTLLLLVGGKIYFGRREAALA